MGHEARFEMANGADAPLSRGLVGGGVAAWIAAYAVDGGVGDVGYGGAVPGSAVVIEAWVKSA